MSYKIIEPYPVNKDIILNEKTYLEYLLDIIEDTDKENWPYFASDYEDVTESFIRFGDLSRIILFEDQNGNKEAVAYVSLKTITKEAPYLLHKDLYNRINISFDRLTQDVDKLDSSSSFYIDVIAIKNNFQNNPLIIKLIIESLHDILEAHSYDKNSLKYTYAVAVTDGGRKMCELIDSKCLENPVSEVIRKVSNPKGKSDNKRTLYQYKTEELIERLNKFIVK